MAVSTSANYNKIISLPGGKKFHSGAHIDFADGRSIEIDDRNIMQGYPAIEDKVSEEGKFELGGAYSSLLTLKLQNWPDEKTGDSPLSDYDFKGAVIKPWVGLTTAVHWRDGEIVEKISKGVFNVTESPEVNSVISATAYDNLVKMDVKYAGKSTLAYPATLAQIAADACSVCGVNLATAAFPNSDYVVAKRPDSGTITCREVLRYAAQLAGCFAKCNRNGDVEIRWYEAPEHIFDIGKNAKTVSTALADTKITGVQIKGNDDSGTVYEAGTGDYAVRITDNPLAQDGLQSLVNALGAQLIGTQFASYSATSPMNPAIETGDIVYLTDKKGTRHTTIVSGTQIEFGDYEQFSGDAESEGENQSERFDKADKAQESADGAQQTADDAQKTADDVKEEVELANVQIGNLAVRVTATESGLSSKVDAGDVSSIVRQSPQDVIYAFNNKDGSTQKVRFTGDGFDFYNGSAYIGHMGISGNHLDFTLGDGVSIQWNASSAYAMQWYPYDQTDGQEGGFHCGNVYPKYLNMKGGNIMNVGTLQASDITNSSGTFRVNGHAFQVTRITTGDGKIYNALLESAT